jgi:hypothetical protein
MFIFPISASLVAWIMGMNHHTDTHFFLVERKKFSLHIFSLKTSMSNPK